MKKVVNDQNAFLEESLAGILEAYPEYLQCSDLDTRAIFRAGTPDKDKVSVITGGGFGHLPLFLGYVGDGLCDGVAVGNIFSTPSASTVYLVTKALPVQKGVLYIIGNYLGDLMNFEMAAERATADKIESKIVIISDDVASAPRGEWRNRRGISGLVFAYKIAGAAAKKRYTLRETACLVEKANENMATFGVAFTSCQLPGANLPVFSIGEDEMELGVGIHGERGVKRVKMMSSHEISEMAVQMLTEDLNLSEGDQTAVLINGLGATSREEQHILFHDVSQCLRSRGVILKRSYLGEYATCLEMSGVSISLLKLDPELLMLLSEPAYSPFISFHGIR
ncbi:MAG: dihydroxyacetone kinase subunit DhaK [Clostridiales bacterium]|jgi:dihydroxyacetone kinase|nr:dihydroxyacetone kinase subunit DhaK [Clostridiales bacterium]